MYRVVGRKEGNSGGFFLMKDKFILFNVPHPKRHYGTLAHCIRCDDEYPMIELVYGARDQEEVCRWYCRNNNCYGSEYSGVYEVQVIFA